MSKPDAQVVASVCLVSELRLPHFASAEIQLFGGYEPKIGDKLTPLSLLAEAESERDDHKFAASTLHTNLIAAYAERDALQARLDGVVALADEFELWARTKDAAAGSNPDSFLKGSAAAYTYVAKAIRAASGGE